jgi:precorrin-2/cobalt-factor-2 C20-methyltransferase
MSEHHPNGRPAAGLLVGVGVGPGDPELVTLKAMRALQQADLVVHFAKNGAASHARAIAASHFKAGVDEMPLYYPVTREVPRETSIYRDALRHFYDTAAARLAAHLDAGRTVAVICEGDPLFYGSYMHLHVRLAPRYRTQVIAGVTGMSGCWSAAGAPIAQGDDVLMVLPATLPESEIERRLKDADAAVVMKLGPHLPKIRRTLARLGRLDRAIYVERGSAKDSAMMRLADKCDDEAPYFAIVLVPGWEERA